MDTPEMYVLSTNGVQPVLVTDSEERSLVGRHHNAVRAFLASGDVSVLRDFQGVVVEGVELETNPAAIEEWWRRRELDFLDIYTG